MEIANDSAKNLPWLRDFYYSRNYQGVIYDNDHVFYIEKGNSPIAVLRISYEDPFPTLRGMEVDRSFQRRGLGTQLLLRTVEKVHSQDLYCIPFTHLEQFYSQGGLEKRPLDTAPAIYQERVADYTSRGMNVILMHKPAFEKV